MLKGCVRGIVMTPKARFVCVVNVFYTYRYSESFSHESEEPHDLETELYKIISQTDNEFIDSLINNVVDPVKRIVVMVTSFDADGFIVAIYSATWLPHMTEANKADWPELANLFPGSLGHWSLTNVPGIEEL